MDAGHSPALPSVSPPSSPGQALASTQGHCSETLSPTPEESAPPAQHLATVSFSLLTWELGGQPSQGAKRLKWRHGPRLMSQSLGTCCMLPVVVLCYDDPKVRVDPTPGPHPRLSATDLLSLPETGLHADPE